ncbi:MAG: DEAD/DEAH box helicase, partial [Kiritimatiellia bacterium]|nr:DEAD/DEAH box helicase [Kiritimatiellia bacterium]
MVLRRLIEKITGRGGKKKAVKAVVPPEGTQTPASNPTPDLSRKPEAKRPDRTPRTEKRTPVARGRTERHKPDGPQRGVAHKPVAAVPHPAPEPWDPVSYVVPPQEGKIRFQDLPLCPELLHACADLEFQYCTPIQQIALPPSLEGKDVAGQAQTGTGKTAAFLLSIFQHMVNHPLPERPANGHPRALIIAPTRELALQIGRDAEALGKYLPYQTLAVVGGQEMDRQRRILTSAPISILAATPGRLLDFHTRREISLSKVEILVLDEADRMLDMGFIPDVRRIIHSTPPRDRRQTFLFSATLSPDILRLASQWTRDPVRLDVEPEDIASRSVEQIVYIVTTEKKTAL